MNDNKTITIGLLLNSIEHYYARRLWRELYKYAAERKCNLLVFCGEQVNTKEESFNETNVIYSLPNSNVLDGIIFTTSSIFSKVSLNEFNEFRNRFKDIPQISIAYEVDGAYSVVIDNEASSKALVTHLIVEHNFKDMFYVSGPLTNKEVRDRKEGFKSALLDHGIAIDENKFLEVDFVSAGGEKAGNYILDNFDMLPQAIACSNDEIAIGVCEALKSRGIDVPGSVAIIGFDNNFSGVIYSPSLTTANQPFERMAKVSLDSLIDSINGIKVRKTHKLMANNIIRESCSCSVEDKIIKKMDIISKMDFSRFIANDCSPYEILMVNKDNIVGYFVQLIGNIVQTPEFSLPYIGEGFDILVEEFVNVKYPILFANKLFSLEMMLKESLGNVLNMDLLLLLLERIFRYLFKDKPYFDYAISFIAYVRLIINRQKEEYKKQELYRLNTVNDINTSFLSASIVLLYSLLPVS